MQLRKFILLLVVFGVWSQHCQAQSLDSLKWQKRILILMEPEGETDVLNTQLSAFESLKSELQERDLIILCYNGQQVLGQDLAPSPYSLSGVVDLSFQGLILIGKDGGIKLKEPFPIEPERIFSLIDGMPMRRAELKRSGKH